MASQGEKQPWLDHLHDPEALLEEIIEMISHCEDFEPRRIAPELACDWNTERDIRTLVMRFCRTMEDYGLLEMSRRDRTEDTKKRCLTPRGKLAIETNAIYHYVLGVGFTHKKLRRSALALCTPGNEHGSAVHVGYGLFLTCAHCVRSKGGYVLSSDLAPEREYEAKVSSIDPSTDIALVSCPELAGLPWIPIALENASILDQVLVLHYPTIPSSTGPLLATLGEVNGTTINTADGNRRGRTDLIISARTAPGSSGGALIGRSGELCGIVVGSGTDVMSTAESPDTGLAAREPFFHAIPVSEFETFVQDRLDHRSETGSYLDD